VKVPTWGIFSASEVGAPHQRKRVFILAVADDQCERVKELGRRIAGAQKQHPARHNGGHRDLEDSRSGGLRPGSSSDTGHESGASLTCDSGSELEKSNRCRCGGGIDRCQIGEKRADQSIGKLEGMRIPTTGYSSSELANAEHLPGCTERGIESREGSHQGSEQNSMPWPSRPGEPQHGWEPPRVVGDTASYDERREPEPAMHREGIQTGGSGCDELGDATQRENDGREPGDVAKASGCGRRGNDAAGGTGESVGDSESGGQRIVRDAAQPGRSGHLDRSNADMLADSESSERHGPGQLPEQTRESELAVSGSTLANADGASAGDHGQHRGKLGLHPQGGNDRGDARDDQWSKAGNRKIESPLGGNSHGAAGRMDYAELCVSCDNRTDELRLLGNGVVPATAEKAFKTLILRFTT